jgi:rhomboid protease GluP
VTGPIQRLPGEPSLPRPSPPQGARLPRYPVWAVYGLLGFIGLVFLGQLVLAPSPNDFDPFLAYGAKVNSLIVRGQWWRLVTPIFIHASLLHFFFNAYALYVLGREIERFYGAGRFLLVFFFAGVCGTTASLWLSRADSVGASGGIFGLIGAEAVLLYRNRRLLGERAQAGLRNIILIAAVNLFIGLQAGSRIDNWAHLGGLVGGLAMAWAVGPVWAFTQEPGLAAMLGTPVQLVDQRQADLTRWVMAGGLILLVLALVTGYILIQG